MITVISRATLTSSKDGDPCHASRGTPSATQLRAGALGAAAVLVASVAATTAPNAQDADRSIFTTIDLRACKVLRRNADGNAWLCRGLPGYPVYVAEGDDRFFLSAGPRPATQRAAQQTLRPFNSLFEGTKPRATLEWRVEKASRPPKPYATIVRYATSRDGAKGQVLVVSKVSPDASCQLAVIDALANPDAIEVARKFADETARTADCITDPKAVGLTGKSPM